MTVRSSIIMGGMAAAIALTVAGGAGATPTPLYGGGSTLVEKVYRDLFNAYGSTSSGDLCTGITIDACPTTFYNANIELLYVGVGSGNGVSALDNHDATKYVASNKKPDAIPTPSGSDFGAFYGTGTGSSWVPAAGGTPAFPTVTFSGSDNVLGATDVTNVANLGFGPVIQIPGVVAAIAVPFNPAPNWMPNGTQPLGGSSKVQLSMNTVCGIFNGDINTWSDPAITKDNGGVQLGTGTITVVFRNDSSGTTFLMSNALLNQCGTQNHKVPRSTHPFPQQWLTDAGVAYNGSAYNHYLSGTSFFIKVFQAGHLPSNFLNNSNLTGVTGGASGSGGVKAAILGTPGSIGYVSPDFVQPVDSTGPQAANLQTFKTFSAKATPVYEPPTAAAATQIMTGLLPPAFSGKVPAAANPLNWGAVAPQPSSATAYPIGGFSFIDLYTCYSSSAVVAGLTGTATGKAGYLTWYYGSDSINNGVPAAILAKNGFAPVPPAWATAINKLLQSSTLGIGVPKSGSTAGTKGCAAISNGA
jgi:ABC-type phosphate transport system substrate-binding protein